MLSVGYFTTLQALFALLLVSPALVGFFVALAYGEVGTLFLTGSLWDFIVVGAGLYLLGLVLPFATLFWVMAIKFCMGGRRLQEQCDPGRVSQVEQRCICGSGASDGWRAWCCSRLRMYRSAPLMAFVLRQLGATVGNNLQCAQDAYLSGPLDLISIEDDVAIQTGAYIQATRWSGQYLHVGPVHLESGCKIGMRAAVANNVTVGRGTWITPFTPILRNVGSHEMWEGAPARLSGRCMELKRTAKACAYAQPDLAAGDPQHPDAGLHILLGQPGPNGRDPVDGAVA